MLHQLIDGMQPMQPGEVEANFAPYFAIEEANELSRPVMWALTRLLMRRNEARNRRIRC